MNEHLIHKMLGRHSRRVIITDGVAMLAGSPGCGLQPWKGTDSQGGVRTSHHHSILASASIAIPATSDTSKATRPASQPTDSGLVGIDANANSVLVPADLALTDPSPAHHSTRVNEPTNGVSVERRGPTRPLTSVFSWSRVESVDSLSRRR